MEFQLLRRIIFLSFIFSLRVASEDVVQEVTTESFELPAFESPENITEAPDDNGMAIGDIPHEIISTTPIAPQSKEEEPSAVEEQPFLVSFPDNHKNFTQNQYLGEQEFPPYYNHLNSYQQQYKNYNEQKQMFSRKPIKFEENSLKNYYPPQSVTFLQSGGDKKVENVRVNRNPFPYTFENEHNQYWNTGNEQIRPEKDSNPKGWYKTPEQLSYQVNENSPEEWYKQMMVTENLANQNSFRGHQENIVPHYIFPHSYPHEDKFYKNEIQHLDHHQHYIKTDEKKNPWKKVFHVLTALVPLGLLLASLTPNVISINSTATSKTVRQRSEDTPPFQFKEEDVLKLMKKYGVESLTEAQCEDRIICELATEGGRNSGGPVEKGFWFLANQTPWDIAEKAGMNDLFKAIKTGNCETYKCQAKTKAKAKAKGSSSSLGKKLIRKHKTAK